MQIVEMKISGEGANLNFKVTECGGNMGGQCEDALEETETGTGVLFRFYF